MTKQKKVAVILAGSGVFDGSEIHETTLTLYALAKQGADYEIFAPDIDQHHVVNHITGEEMPEKRNVLIESARIARGNIKALEEYNPDNFDALIFPGGFGVAKNLCSFAFDGPDMQVLPLIEKVIIETNKKSKPIGALCISPVMIAKILGDVNLTIGQDQDAISAIQKMGAKHETTNHGDVIIDREKMILTTPCYMLEGTIDQIGKGAENLVNAILEM